MHRGIGHSKANHHPRHNYHSNHDLRFALAYDSPSRISLLVSSRQTQTELALEFAAKIKRNTREQQHYMPRIRYVLTQMSFRTTMFILRAFGVNSHYITNLRQSSSLLDQDHHTGPFSASYPSLIKPRIQKFSSYSKHEPVGSKPLTKQPVMNEGQIRLLPVAFSKHSNTNPHCFCVRFNEKCPLKRFQAKLASVTQRNDDKIGRKTKIFQTKAEKLN
jgi:hypothetical protein